jgi:hypothetical protein
MTLNRFSKLAAVMALLALIVFFWRQGGRLDDVKVPAPSDLKAETQPTAKSPPTSLLPEASMTGSTSVVEIDPANQELANRLSNPESAPEDDLEIVQSFLQIYSKAQGGNPTGDNSDITSAMTGTNGHRGRVFPRNHPSIREGQMVDRWGTPYWFHPNSGHSMEIRSAGPDRQLFTQDDLVLNPSPEGFGAGQVQ